VQSSSSRPFAYSIFFLAPNCLRLKETAEIARPVVLLLAFAFATCNISIHTHTALHVWQQLSIN
jgi:hypothetical protein